MDEDQLYYMMRKRVVAIEILPVSGGGEIFYQSGVIVDCGSNFAYIISDPRKLMGKIGVSEIKITFPDEQIVHPRPEHFHIRNGVVGIVCHEQFNADLVEKIEIYNQPLLMSEKVFVYEGVIGRITGGNITLFDGDHFSNNCAVSIFSEYGAPVVTKNGELVGICDSTEYHHSAKSILSLLGTIETIKSSFAM